MNKSQIKMVRGIRYILINTNPKNPIWVKAAGQADFIVDKKGKARKVKR